VAEWEAALAAAPLRKISERAIDDEARRGLAANTQRTQQQIGRRLPAFMNSLIRYGVGVLDWELRRAGGFSYRVYCFVKD
ncbi:MAG TPA: class I SAM-dependent methyltransferase, partial [Mycobacterium sp.]|nr:class I SAM-dependent methyltransferase [Mycobacterium sp.]